jgi:pimeloyl-ACP methyl ester carboxylesterase
VSTFGDKITTAAWKNKPSWYQISSNDRMLAPETEKMMSDRLGAKKVITLDASHASLASRPDEVTALIDEAANATQS